MKTVIGIDLGGTNVRVAKVTLEGKIIQEFKSPCYAQEGPEKVTSNIIELLGKIDDIKSCSGIGIGVAGPVDTVTKQLKMSTNLPGLAFYPICEKIEKAFGLPTYMDNDANVAGLAEALLGAGRGHKVVYFIIHGTGVGGALVVNGQVVSGKNGYAGEIGNIIVTRDGEKVNHLNIGAVENLASGAALIKIAQKRINPNISTAYEIFKLAKAGDITALDIVDKMAFDFASACSAIGHVVDPSIFVVGGGVVQSHELYFPIVKKYYDQMVHEGMRGVQFIPAELDEPGILGAAMLPISQGN
jgi:glucokinase